MRILTMIGGALLLLLPRETLLPATINVPAQYPSIQAAIAAASNGDTVVVAPGTYLENINFLGKAITVESSAGPATTIIDGNDKDSVVRFGTKETASSVLQGFTIRNGNPSSNNSYLGGGVSITGASPTITGNVITRNYSSGNGAGISIQAAAPIIQGNTITANFGEGIYVLGSSGSSTGPQIIGNVISNNTSGYFGAGIDLFASGPVLIQNNLIMGNKGSQGGGIGMVNGSNPTIIQNVIVGNTGSYGGGFYSITPSGATAYLLNNTIAGNSSQKGSSVYVDGADFGVQMVNNILISSQGQGAVYCGNSNTTSQPLMSFNDVVGAPGRNYEGLCPDQTGQNGNISSNPLFDCPTGNNYRLAPGSPGIGAGSALAAGLPPTDYDGNPRVANGKVDMGAYAFLGPAFLSVSPPALAFGNQLVGAASAPQTVTLQNTGTLTCWLCGFTLANDFTQSNNCGDHLNAGASCTVSVALAPATEGSKSTALVVNANTASPLQVSLMGTGTNPAPVLNALSPASVITGGQSFMLTVSGSGFVSDSMVLWNGSSRPTKFLSTTQLLASISAQDIAQPGVVQVTVSNPTPGGGASAAAAFTIANLPCTYAISPGGQAFAAAGGSGTITVTAGAGCSWTAASTAAWITIGGGTGTGNGVVSYQVAANAGGAATASITIANLSFTVDIAAASIAGYTNGGSMAQLASGGAWTTTFTFVNLGSASAQIRLSFFDNNGKPLILPLTFPQSPGAAGPLLAAMLDQSINPNAELVIQTAGPVLQVGWAQLLTNGNINGFAMYSSASGNSIQDAEVPLQTANASEFVLPYDNTNGAATGIALANTTAQPLSVSINVLATGGAVIQSGTLSLPAMGHASFYLSTQYPATAQQLGTVELVTPLGGQICVLGLRFNATGAFSTIPALSQ
jgi:hypothetical protein